MHERQSLWKTWRQPLAAIVVVATLFGMAARAQGPQSDRWAWLPFRAAPVETKAGTDTTALPARFFVDSQLVVYLDAHEGRTLPIRINVYYSGDGIDLSEIEIRDAMIYAVGQRRGARFEVEPVGMMMGNDVSFAPAPGVTIAYDFWPGGGARSDIVLSCPKLGPGGRVVGTTTTLMASNRGLMRIYEGVRQDVTRLLNTAAQQRCARSVAQSVVPRVAAGAVRLMTSVDTVRLRVGDAVDPDRAMKLRAVAADGSEMSRVVPYYETAEPTIARMSGEGIVGVAPGVTRLRIAMLNGSATPTANAASVTVFVKVTP